MFALIDCNNFYASCERVFNPRLEGKPIVILSNNDGCIISRSNEAKDLGIKMGEPAFKMKDILEKNKVYVFSSNYALYGDLSERVMSALSEFVPDIEIYSIDESFLDLSGIKYQNLLDFGIKIKKNIKQWTGIPVSIGIAPTKTLAKVANHIVKNEERKARTKEEKTKVLGVCILQTKEDIEKALIDFPVEEIWGIGWQYAKFLRKNKINTAMDLCNANDDWIKKHLSVVGLRIVTELRGIPCYVLEMEAPSKKNICNARSFGKMTSDIRVLEEAVSNYSARCAEKLRLQGSCANMLCVFLQTNRFKENEPQYNNFKVIHLPVATNISSEIIKYALIGLNLIFKPEFRYKKAGVIVSGIVPENNVQTNIFDNVDRGKNKTLMETIDKINVQYGKDVIRSASQGYDRKWKLRQEKLSPCYTTRWSDMLTIGV